MASGFFLADKDTEAFQAVVPRFDPKFWTVNFPRPMMASVRTLSANSFRADCNWIEEGNLCGLIWSSEDTLDHPLNSYETNKDYSGVTLTFRWQSTGVEPLDSSNPPVLTIEGRTQDGVPKSWFVRLWNYKTSGTGTDCIISLPFSALDGGFILPNDADPVFPGNIDRMFISLIPPGFVENSTTLFPLPKDGHVIISDIEVTGGPNASLAVKNALRPPHEFYMCTAFDDSYNLTPERVLYNIQQLGYRKTINHYVGMSHYMQLRFDIGDNALRLYNVAGQRLNAPTRFWHSDFFERAKDLGFEVIVSLSYEMFNSYCPTSWRQLDSNGGPALTGWVPPSTILIPTLPAAMNYLQGVAIEFMDEADAVGAPLLFQIGEPWWWVNFTDQRPCFYDAYTTALYFTETGLTAPVITDMKATLNSAQLAYLDWLGTKLGISTNNLRDAVKTAYPSTKTLLLFYAPQVQSDLTPELYRANRPAAWNYPAYDILQLEDYTFVSQGNVPASELAAETVTTLLGYPVDKQHYFSGFVLLPQDAPTLWPLINNAANRAVARGVSQVFFWAQPQINRDGFTVLGSTELSSRAWGIELDGHQLLVLRAGADKTFVYDLQTGQWSSWDSPFSSVWRPLYGINWINSGEAAFNAGTNIVCGDSSTGVLWMLDPEQPYDDSPITEVEEAQPFTRTATAQVPVRGREFIPVYDLFLTASKTNNLQVSPNVGLYYSDDGADTFVHAGDIASDNSFTQEFAWRSLGRIQAPGRIFHIVDEGALSKIDTLDINTITES
jgi:hypothetical protein